MYLEMCIQIQAKNKWSYALLKNKLDFFMTDTDIKVMV